MHQDWHSNLRTEKIKKTINHFFTFHQKKAFFYRQMAVMLRSGISIIASLRELKKQTMSKNISESLLFYIEKGETLSFAMEKSRGIFSNFEVKSVFAAEISGNLAEIMEKLAHYFETLQDVKYRLFSGMIYPAILLHAAIIIPAIPLLFTKSVFAFFSRILPMFILIYGIVFGIFFLYRFFSKSEMLEARDSLLIRAPLGIGNLFKTVSLIRFLQAFNCLYSAGVGIVESIKVSAEASGNRIIEKEILKSGKIVEQGGSLYEAFSKNIFLPPLVLDMIQTGEESGRLDETTEKAIWHLQQNVNLAVEAILKIFPVVVYLLVALYVASIVISFYSNYFSQINNLLE